MERPAILSKAFYVIDNLGAADDKTSGTFAKI